MNVMGIPCSKEEVADFQRFAPNSKAAILLERILLSVEKIALDDLANIGIGDIAIRQAQGALMAVRKIEEIAVAIAQVSLETAVENESEETVFIEEEDDNGRRTNVSF